MNSLAQRFTEEEEHNMQIPYSSSPFVCGGMNDALPRSRLFWLSSLAFIVYFTPFLAVSLRGLYGFVLFLGLGIMAGVSENSRRLVVRSVSEGIAQNMLLFFFLIWYLADFVIQLLCVEGGLANWRLIVTPVAILIGICYMFAFMHNDLCYRYFQITFIVVSGLQAVLSIQVLTNTTDIARMMWVRTSGAWIYGNQIVFAIYAMIVPMLFWRAFQESGRLKLFLLLSCILIATTSAMSSFGTPIGLIVMGVATISILSLFIAKRQGRIRVLLINGIILIIALLGYQLTRYNPLFASSYYRVENFIRDPTSGGYRVGDAGDSRWYLAEMSIQSFRAAPIFGMGGIPTNNPYLGGHSSFFDSLGLYGLLGGGGALIAIMLIILVKATVRFWHERNWETLLALTTVLLLVVGGVVNPYWGGPLPVVLIMARPFLRSAKKHGPILSPHMPVQSQKYHSRRL